MRERPILFSGAMVRAILDGRKTQTRRVVRGLSDSDARLIGELLASGGTTSIGVGGYGSVARVTERTVTSVPLPRCPYGAPGDRLWVRETWAPVPWKAGCEYAPDRSDGAIGYRYRATWDRAHAGRWRPSIHMPRRASRITLELTDVRVERVQDISIGDVLAEGVGRDDDEANAGQYWREATGAKYAALWDSLNAKRAAGWDVNPWVWVLDFTRVGSA